MKNNTALFFVTIVTDVWTGTIVTIVTNLQSLIEQVESKRWMHVKHIRLTTYIAHIDIWGEFNPGGFEDIILYTTVFGFVGILKP
jgi:hypothetical protein